MTKTDAYSEMLAPAARSLPLTDGVSSSGKSHGTQVTELRRWARIAELFDYQTQVADGLLRRGMEGEPLVGLLALPTGAGKTITAAWTLLRWLKAQPAGSNAIWLAPQSELLEQAIEACRMAWSSGNGPDRIDLVPLMQNRRHDTTATSISFATPQLLLATGTGVVPGSLSGLIFDEAHHVVDNAFGATWQQLLNVSKPKWALGLSATPIRNSQVEMRQLQSAFGDVLFTPAALGARPVEELVRRGVLAEPQFCLIPGVPEFARARGPEDSRRMRSLTTVRERWEAIIRCAEVLEHGSTIIFALNRAHGSAITQALRARGIRAEYVDGRTGWAERVSVFDRFRLGRSRIIVSVALLLEGIDCPAAEAAILTYPVGSTTRLRQMLGRVLRGPLTGGTPHARVWAAEGDDQWVRRHSIDVDYRRSGWRVVELA